MHLESLEISGFKSFAKKAVLQFASPITGIVGPNGSGKSNVAEAFRFVLGEQSIKSLRGKRGEDMIWNGGGSSAAGSGAVSGRANRASVKVIFDNSDKLFAGIDFDKVTIERIVNRDNTNEYLLNGTQVRLKDIIELLAGAHIGATGHHIISQGEADHILSASIRERREMIEDALGLKIHQWKKAESIRKLERADDNVKQVESLRREIAPHLRFLKKQVEKVEKAEEMRRDLIALYKEYFAHEDHRVRTEKERLKKGLAGPVAELAELDRSLEKAKGILTASKGKDKKSDGVISIEGRLAEARAEKDGVTREIGRLEGEINANSRAKEKEEGRRKQEEFRTVYLKDVEDMIRSVESLGSIADAKALFAQVIRSLKDFVARHRSSNDSELIAEAEKEIAALSKQRASCEKRLEALADSESRLAREYEDLKAVIEKEKDTDREAEKDVFRIIARQNEARHVADALTSELDAILRQEEALKRELGEAANMLGREAVEYTEYTERQERGKKQEETGAGNASREWAEQEECRRQIERFKVRLEDSGGLGGSEVMKEYRETEERDAFLARELADLAAAKEELARLIAELDVRIDFEFKSGILKINAEFGRFFLLMFGGGHAELAVVKEPRRRRKSDLDDIGDIMSLSRPAGESPASSLRDVENFAQSQDSLTDGPEGLDVSVSLPRKRVKGLIMLSGGERALTSIALLFAISQVNPPPFIILDETDAALDEANSKKYGDMIGSLSKRSQLILITHNRETMSRAGVIYGVTMGSDGASKLLSIAFEEAVKVAK